MTTQIILSILIGISLGLIALITAIGNLIVLFAFYYDKKLRTINDYFIMNMAIADFLVGSFCIPFYIPFSIHQIWPFGRLFCKIWVTVDDVATMASVINIVAISVNRYWLIAYPISYRKYVSEYIVYLVMGAIWFLSFINFAPGIWLISLFDKTLENRSDCSGDYNHSFIYMLIAQFNYFIWPFIVLYDKSLSDCQLTNPRKRSFTEDYSPIIQTKNQINKQTNQLDISIPSKRNSNKDACSSSFIILSTKAPNCNSRLSRDYRSDSPVEYKLQTNVQNVKPINDEIKENRHIARWDLRIKRDRKAARSLLILVIVFYDIFISLSSTAGFQISTTLFEVSFWLLWLNSTCNPFLYPFIQINYRRAYAKLFQSCFKHFTGR